MYRLGMAVKSSVIFALACLSIIGAPTILALSVAQIGWNVEFSAWQTVWFSAGYGAVLGLLTTPLVANNVLYPKTDLELHLDGDYVRNCEEEVVSI